MSAFSSTFLGDLERVFSAGEVDLTDLGRRLDVWRVATRERLESEVARLQPDDPLLCPVGLFGPLDYGRLEVAQTRALAWFLDPRREHGFGTQLLTAFLRLVCPEIVWSGVTAQRVEGEWLIDIRDTDTANRLDVYAYGSFDGRAARKWVLAVEAKIDANEGREQLGRYDTWIQAARSDSRKVRIVKVYLTPDGRHATTGDKHWRPVSFRSLALAFRHEWANAPPGSEVGYLRHYVAGLLKQICCESIPIQAGGSDPYCGLDLLARCGIALPREGQG